MGKRLGQNFLTNKDRVVRIVDSLNISKKDVVVEIGPGKGAITEEILKRNPKQFIGVEKDKRLAKKLETSIAPNKSGVEIIEGDILKVLPELAKRYELNATNYKLIGNIPFYLTGYLLRTIGELAHKPDLSVLLVQKEVAERIVAEPPKMNILAASIQFWAVVKYLGKVPKESFNPQPKVDGGVVMLRTRRQKKARRQEGKKYYKTIKAVFKHPRKTILNNIMANKELAKKGKEDLSALLKKCGTKPTERPENLDVDKTKELANLLW